MSPCACGSPCQCGAHARHEVETWNARTEAPKAPGRWRIRPASTNAGAARITLEALGITVTGFHHASGCFIGCSIPDGVFLPRRYACTPDESP